MGRGWRWCAIQRAPPACPPPPPPPPPPPSAPHSPPFRGPDCLPAWLLPHLLPLPEVAQHFSFHFGLGGGRRETRCD